MENEIGDEMKWKKTSGQITRRLASPKEMPSHPIMTPLVLQTPPTAAGKSLRTSSANFFSFFFAKTSRCYDSQLEFPPSAKATEEQRGASPETRTCRCQTAAQKRNQSMIRWKNVKWKHPSVWAHISRRKSLETFEKYIGRRTCVRKSDVFGR